MDTAGVYSRVKNTVYISWNNILYRVAAVYIAYRALYTTILPRHHYTAVDMIKMTVTLTEIK